MVGPQDFSNKQSPNSDYPTLDLTLGDLELGLDLGILTQACQHFKLQHAKYDFEGVIMKFSII